MKPNDEQLDRVYQQLTCDQQDANETEIKRAREALDLIERVRVAQAAQLETPVLGETLPDRPPASQNFELPSQIGRFEIINRIGQGGFGLVLHARDPKLNRDVALKIPRIEIVASRELRDRFRREARAAPSTECRRGGISPRSRRTPWQA